jgi:hypothetical protein
MNRFAAALLFATAALSSCAGHSRPTLGINSLDVAHAHANYPGFIITGDGGSTIAIDCQPGNILQITMIPAGGEHQPLATVHLPTDWQPAGYALSSPRILDQQYHWAITHWRTPTGDLRILALRAFGPDDIYLDLDNQRHAIGPGAVMAIADGPTPSLAPR